MKICVAGAYGAFGIKHLDAIAAIDGVEVVSIMGPNRDRINALASARAIPEAATSLETCLQNPAVEAVILATPTQYHAAQAIAAMRAGKHVLVEIPMADSLADSRAVVAAQQATGVVAMSGQVRRFNPSHQWIHSRIAAGELTLQQMDVQTYFFRRTNTNAKGEPRSWTDHLLWHHACHTVDLFQYQTGQTCSEAYGFEGPLNRDLGIAMDMSIGLKVPSGALCTISLSFNNDGPLGTFFRYICDNGTYLARYDDLFDGYERPIDLTGVAVSNNGIELIDREFFDAIQTGRAPNGAVGDVLGAMETLDRIERSMRH